MQSGAWAGDELSQPEPERASDHEEHDAQSERGGAGGDIDIVFIGDDDAGEGRRQSASHYEHIEVGNLHFAEQADDEGGSRHKKEFKDGAEHSLPIDSDLNR